MGFLFTALRGDHNLHSHVAGNAACTLTQIAQAPGGAELIVGHPDQRRLGQACAELLDADPGPYLASRVLGVVTRLVSALAGTPEGAGWAFRLPRNVRRRLFSGLFRQIRDSDVASRSECAHALSQLLLHTDPDLPGGGRQRGHLYDAAEAYAPGALFARHLRGPNGPGPGEGADGGGGGGAREIPHPEKYERGLCASEEIAVAIAEMLIDRRGSTLLAREGDEVVDAAFAMLRSPCLDNVAAGCDLVMRLCESREVWVPHLGPSGPRIGHLHCALGTPGAHRHVLPALNRLLHKEGWVAAFVGDSRFPVIAAMLAGELEEIEPRSSPAGNTGDGDGDAGDGDAGDGDAGDGDAGDGGAGGGDGGDGGAGDGGGDGDGDEWGDDGSWPTDEEERARDERDERVYASSWAAGTIATLVAGSDEAGAVFASLPDFAEAGVDRLVSYLAEPDVRSAAAAALGSLYRHVPVIQGRLEAYTAERGGDGLGLALLESAGVAPEALRERIRALPLPDKRQWLVTRLQQDHGPQAPDGDRAPPPQAARVSARRDDVAARLCREVASGEGLGGDLRGGVEVHFEEESGQGAAVLREWLSLVAADLSRPELNLLVSRNGGQSYQPSAFAADTLDPGQAAAWFEALGRALGLSVFHGTPFGLVLTHGCLRYLTGQPPAEGDLRESDPEAFARKVEWLRETPIDDLGLGLCFTDVADDTGVFRPPAEEVELRAGGAAAEVTDANKGEYCRLVAAWRTRGCVAGHLEAVRRGLAAVVPAGLLARCGELMSPDELSALLFGERELDVEDWRAHTRVEGRALASGPGRELVGWFWDVVGGLGDADRRALLQFTTACTSLPVGGFARLQSAHGVSHPFTLAELTGREGSNALPRASACFNTLYLPR